MKQMQTLRCNSTDIDALHILVKEGFDTTDAWDLILRFKKHVGHGQHEIRIFGELLLSFTYHPHTKKDGKTLTISYEVNL